MSNEPCRRGYDRDDNEVGCTPDRSGVCPACDHVTCFGCGARVPAETAGAADGYRFCAACFAAPDSDGVPVEVGDDDTSAVRTVRAVYEPIGVEGLGDVRANRRAA